MLAVSNRLKGDKNFERVKKEGKLYQYDNFGVIVYKRGDRKPPRFAFIISTKISKAAVHRNRIKRAMSEAVRHRITNIRKGLDVLFLTKREILTRTTEEVMKSVNEFVDDKLLTAE
jgi:ribonuclease P protein component